MGLLDGLNQQQGPIVRTMAVYCKAPTDGLKEKIKAKFNEYNMKFDFHPLFSFDTIAGYLPVSIESGDICAEDLRNKTYKTGFELFVDTFDLEKDFPSPKKTIFNKNKPDAPKVSAELDPVLAQCDTVLTFNIEDSESLGLRAGVLMAAFMAEITGGVFLNATSRKWRASDVAVKEMYDAVKSYEENIGNWRVREFVEW